MIFKLTDTGEDSKLAHRRKCPKVDALFFSLFFRRVRATSMTQRRVENTRVNFWTFSPLSVKIRNSFINKLPPLAGGQHPLWRSVSVEAIVYIFFRYQPKIYFWRIIEIKIFLFSQFAENKKRPTWELSL